MHVGLVARGWLDCLVFSWVFNLACSSTIAAIAPAERRRRLEQVRAASAIAFARCHCIHRRRHHRRRRRRRRS